ncbi:MAG: ComF family protein [Paludibacteraceae bacterium]|nr:ComF family protein [Paludibacteraceae bacterium]
MLSPRTCPACGQVLADEEELCPDCVNHIQRTEQALNRDNSTEDIFRNLPHFVYGGCWAFYVKQTYFQLLIHNAKFGLGNPELLRYLGRIAAREWEETGFFDGIDYIVPIPLHWRRLRERGFNQSEYICKGLSEVLNIPIDTTHLTRERYNKKQSQSSFHERLSAVRGIFSLNHPEEWYGKTIMIVDDILTTGSTLKAAIETMKEVYNSRIVVFALAKAK